MPVDEKVLQTGLFSLRSKNRLGWAHQTYAEFLAALYSIDQHQLPPTQIDTLLMSSGGSGTKLVPQLHETAAWLASLDIVVFRRIA